MLPHGDIQVDDGPRFYRGVSQAAVGGAACKRERGRQPTIETQRRSPRQRRRQQEGGSLGEAAHVGLGHQNSTFCVKTSNVTMCLRAEGRRQLWLRIEDPRILLFRQMAKKVCIRGKEREKRQECRECQAGKGTNEGCLEKRRWAMQKRSRRELERRGR